VYVCALLPRSRTVWLEAMQGRPGDHAQEEASSPGGHSPVEPAGNAPRPRVQRSYSRVGAAVMAGQGWLESVRSSVQRSYCGMEARACGAAGPPRVHAYCRVGRDGEGAWMGARQGGGA